MDTSNWTYEDFLAYLLMYAAEMDFDTDERETSYLLEKIDAERYERIRKLVTWQKDWDHALTIRELSDKFCPDEASREKVLNEIKALFLADNEYSAMEQALFTGLRKLLR